MAENANAETNEVVSTTEEGQPKTYTEEEVQALLQSESDRRVSQALKKAEQKKLEEVREAKKLASMNAQEKYEYELQQRELAIQAKERELALAENRNEASKILADKGISLDLVDFVVADDAETMSLNIKKLEKAFKASVKAEVEKRIGSNVPKKNLMDESAITKEQFNKMTLAQLQQLKNSEPEIYNSFKH